MQPSFSMPTDSSMKEDLGLTASASSSSRLNHLSSSSRRLRHVSPPSTSKQASQKKGPVANQYQFASAAKLTFHTVFHFPSLPGFNDEPHRAAPRSPPTRTGRAVRGVFLVWTWFCLFYFSIAAFDALRRTAISWPWHAPSSATQALIDSPEHILTTLPLEHRLSKLSSLSPLPDSLQPFILGPRRHEDNPMTACLWSPESHISQLRNWTSSWLGPVSLLVTTSANPDSSSYEQMLSRLTSLSQTAPNISFHVLHTPSSLRNFNAYINLARLLSPSSKILLFPPFSISLSAPLPRASTDLLNAMPTTNEDFVIPMRSPRISNNSDANISVVFFPSSALFLDRDRAPWCTERFFTITQETSSEGKQGRTPADPEMAQHWKECLWNVWLHSAGKIKMSGGEGWAISEDAEAPLQLEPMSETVEASLHVRLAGKQRSETCMLVARELIALGQWYETVGPLPLSEGSEVLPGGTETAEKNRLVSTLANAPDTKARRAMKESPRAEWLRSVCRQTLDRWGKELID